MGDCLKRNAPGDIMKAVGQRLRTGLLFRKGVIQMRRCWVEISISQLIRNLDILRRDCPLEAMAVVKADAYGHGDGIVSSCLQKHHVCHFAVSNLNEAENLRTAGVTGDILILGYTPPEYADDLKRLDITQALISEEYARQLAGKGIKAQAALDTGMNRIGLNAKDPARCERLIREYAKEFCLTGIFTHLCVADTPAEDGFTRLQIERFNAVANAVSDLCLAQVHCMNSAGSLRFAPTGNLSRLGIVLYGLKPDLAMTLPEGIKPILAWKTVVAMVKDVEPGETIGYGRSFTVGRKTKVATLPVGYADGYNRLLSNKGFVMLHGQKAPILGKVCMDQMMVDVTGIDDVHMGDEVTLLGDGYTADEMGRDCGTIGYEVICDISKRVERVYIEQDI